MQPFNQYLDEQANLLVKKAEKLENRSFRWHAYWATIFTIYWFQVTVPALLGVFLGILLDKHCPLERISWTLNLILIGFGIGLFNANRWFYRMMELHKNSSSKRKGGKK